MSVSVPGGQGSSDPKLLERVARANVEVSEDDLFRFGGELYASRSFLPILITGLRAPEYTLRDALHVKKGADLVGREMRYDIVPAPLRGEIPNVDVPVFFFLGRHDFNTPSQLAAEYLERLDAPLKRLVWFEHSAHFPFFEEPDFFDREMVRVQKDVSAFYRRQAAGEEAARSSRSPNPRLQRTPLRAPLSRKPLGVFKHAAEQFQR
jgi:pimeloyl-ACP methyl ester carboxylesterase